MSLSQTQDPTIRPPKQEDEAADRAVSPRPTWSEEDWRKLVRRYADVMRYALRRRIPVSSDVDELVQQALLQAVVGWPTFRGEAEVSTWVFGIAQNLARNHVSRPAGPVQFGLGDAVDAAPCNAPDPFEQLAQRERVKRLQEGLEGLPKNQTEALWLVGVDGLSYEEAATTMGVSVAAVKHRVARARATLRESRI
jgi:RNA polymerase sigma factor (sigma-70 family)